MEWRRFTDAYERDFAPVWALYGRSFPENERRIAWDQAWVMEDTNYACEAVYEKGELLALLFSWRMGKWQYIEHFAVNDARRGAGVGTRVLKDFFSRHENVVLEIDPPQTSIAQRRERFYARVGMASNSYAHRHWPYRVGYAPHALKVLSFPREMNEEEYGAFAEALASQVMRYALLQEE